MNQTKTIRELVVELKPSEFFSDETRWCRGMYAKDKYNRDVNLLDFAACKLCLNGYFYLKHFLTKQNKALIEYSVITQHLMAKYEKGTVGFNDSIAQSAADVVKELQEVGL